MVSGLDTEPSHFFVIIVPWLGRKTVCTRIQTAVPRQRFGRMTIANFLRLFYHISPRLFDCDWKSLQGLLWTRRPDSLEIALSSGLRCFRGRLPWSLNEFGVRPQGRSDFGGCLTRSSDVKSVCALLHPGHFFQRRGLTAIQVAYDVPSVHD